MPALAARGADGVEIARGEVLREPLQALAERPEADDHQLGLRDALEHERPGGEQEVDALGGDQLADEDHEPVLLRADRRERVGGGGRIAREGGVAIARRRVPQPLHQRAEPVRARRPARAGVNSAMSTPGGPSFVRASTLGSPIAAHRLSAVWRDPTSTAARARGPRGRRGGSARGSA